uniref:Putative secreted protein n=1 Tax=Ixodes ricinus TaxID=34613 RepID=A0A6B0UHD8_IXORI
MSYASSAAPCTVCTILFVSSRQAMAVEVVKEFAPRWRPRTIRPSLRYCSTGSQTRSRIPLNSCTKECMGPTPPRTLGSWFFLMSLSHSLSTNASSLSIPNNPCL